MTVNQIKAKKMTNGVVTFLDILGWKGIWQRNPKAMDKVIELINIAIEVQGNINLLDKNNKVKKLKVEVMSISDTIVLYSKGNTEDALDFHGAISGLLIAMSIQNGIPLRGATSYGKFSINGNIMVGPAIDEVASWYEVVDWIGLIMTPTALFKNESWSTRYLSNEFSFNQIFIPYTISTKNNGKQELMCVNWVSQWDANKTTTELFDCFSNIQPIFPDVASKIMNTINFFRYVQKLKENI